MSDEKLTPKQKAFIREYLLCRNGTEAARKAGYKGNDKTLGVIAAENLAKPSIKSHIEKNEQELQKKFDIQIEDLITGLAKIAFFDPMSVLEIDKKGRLIYKKDADLTGANFTIYPEYQNEKDKADGVQRARLSIMSGDRKGSIELIGKHLGAFKDGRTGTDQDSKRDVLARLQNYFQKNRRDGSGGST